MSYQVLLFYKYVSIEDPIALAGFIKALAEKHRLLGRVRVAAEGINATLEGNTKQAELFASEILKLKDVQFSEMNIKWSEGDGNTFNKLSVKVRDEIVGTRFGKEVDPTKNTGRYLRAEEFRHWHESSKEFVVVDMRNDFEYKAGHFKHSINPGLRYSRDLPQALPLLKPYKNKTVVTVCTGGIRCEKMSAYLLKEGFTDVYQLEHGIHDYMQKYPGKDFLGTLYTFDNRLTMDFGGTREVVGTCEWCHQKTELYVNCKNADCHRLFLLCDTCCDDHGSFCSAHCVDETVSYT